MLGRLAARRARIQARTRGLRQTHPAAMHVALLRPVPFARALAFLLRFSRCHRRPFSSLLSQFAARYLAVVSGLLVRIGRVGFLAGRVLVLPVSLVAYLRCLHYPCRSPRSSGDGTRGCRSARSLVPPPDPAKALGIHRGIPAGRTKLRGSLSDACLTRRGLAPGWSG